MDDAAAILEAVVNHAALPPKAPQRQDSELGIVESRIGRQLLNACRKIRDLVGSYPPQYNLWDGIRLSLENSLSVTLDGQIDRARLSVELQGLQDDRFLILHVTEQNAGLFIYNSNRHDGDHVVFEAFEASATSEQVQKSRGALIRRFPGRAVEIPRSVFDQATFQDQLAEDIERLSTESVKQFTATSRKDGSGTHESRETTSPEAITGWLMSVLEGFGRPVVVRPLEKRMYDEVNWHKAELPWRRSPFLTVLKVGLQRALLRSDADEGQVHYKYLIAVFLAELLDSITSVSESSVFLQTKLGYRMAKLEGCKSPKTLGLFALYAKTIAPFLAHTATAVERRITDADDRFKDATAPTTSSLPRTADAEEFKLNLTASGAYIANALAVHPDSRLDNTTSLTEAVNEDKNDFIKSYRELANQEIALKAPGPDPSSGKAAESLIQRTSDQLDSYISAVGQAYDDNPALMSSLLLLVMETWVRIDKAAIVQYPLLEELPPPFHPRMLDVLRPDSFVDMQRLNEVHQYLDKRSKNARSDQKNMFCLQSGCFAARYYDSDTHMKAVLNEITADATTTRADRKREWEQKSAEWQKLNDEYNTKSHRNSKTGEYVSAYWEDHPRSRCPKCQIFFRMKKVTIQVFEWPLVSEGYLAKATVFELVAPPSLLRYRDITVHILRRFAFRPSANPQVCHTTVRQYTGLRDYVHGASSSLTLGSATKSEYQTHRSKVNFKVKLETVCPETNHMSLAYVVHDARSGEDWWMPDFEKCPPSFMHLFADAFLQNTPFERFCSSSLFSVAGKGPTSNEVIATQVSCPSKVGQREFMAFQTLFSGFERRWPQILLALGSSDLNFSSESVVLLINRLATQAGPSAGSNPLRVVHVPLEESNFRHSLCTQLHARLEALEGNWREIITMRLIVTIALRLCVVSSSRGNIVDGIRLIDKARYMLQSWVQELRLKHSVSCDRESATQYSRYASEAALLCKRTYAVFTYPLLQSKDTLTVREVQCFMESSITVYKYLVEAPKDVPQRISNDLAIDAQLGYHLEPLIYHSLQAQPRAILRAIIQLWPGLLTEEMTKHSTPRFMPAPGQDWLNMSVYQKDFHVELHYHVITGCALINGHAQKALPDTLSRSPVLDELFGRQNFETTASRFPGMTYHLRIGSPDYEVHLGFRESDLIVRLVTRDKVFELIPREVFGPPDKGDLPAPLMVDCFHWLNLHTRQIEVRPGISKFEEDENNWVLHLGGIFSPPMARRGDGSVLVEKGSTSHTRICGLLSNFEQQNQLVVLQRQDGTLAVELPRCELTFFVNDKTLLECEQLHGELKPKQDCGTWYGLLSKLVLRDTVNTDLETVVVPIGSVHWERTNTHVTVRVAGYGPYGKFTVNKENHRVDAPPEPRLLYTKALLHALTALSTKDRLTGMTGTESALRCLDSSLSKPYAPLTTGANFALPILAKFTPHREFYPKGRKVQQEIYWDEHLPFWTQHEAFRPLVERIRARSNNLVAFTPDSATLPDLKPPINDKHPPERSLLRRARYEMNPNGIVEHVQQDLIYEPRDTPGQQRKHINVFQCARLFASWNSDFPTTQYLSTIMQSWVVIAGFEGQVAPAAFGDRFGLRIAEAFGSLLQMCREAGTGDRWRLAFMLSPFCYHHDVEMDIVRTLIAVAISDELKEPEPPKWPLFERFEEGVQPGKDQLLEVIQPYIEPFVPSVLTIPGITLTKRQRRRLETEKDDYDRRVREELSEVADFVLGHEIDEDIDPDACTSCSRIEADRALEAAMSERKRLRANYELSTYVRRLQALLDDQGIKATPLPRAGKLKKTKLTPYQRMSSIARFSLSDIIRMPQITQPSSAWFDERSVDDLSALMEKVTVSDKNDTPEIQELDRLVQALKHGDSEVRSTYANDLEKSVKALRLSRSREATLEASSRASISDREIRFAEEQVLELRTWIERELQARNPASKWLVPAGLWPSTNPSLLLSEIRSQLSGDLGQNEKRFLIELGLRINALQRLKRIRDAERRGATIRAHQERQNVGHTNWTPMDYPDWLLIEVDSNVMIREEQVDVARATINPPSAKNSCLQLNMGGGKSSVILPMCASVLANKAQLVRIVVPRALLLQTAQVLQSKLGGLLDREVRHVPFSRRAPQDADSIKKYRHLHQDVLSSGGVMLCLPEHMLSFKLSGQQRLADESLETGSLMVRTQEWLETKTRDVIDECDEILSSKCQLVYPSGSQLAVDGHPYRWEVIQELLDAASWHADRLSRIFPNTFEVVRRNDTLYPVIFFLRPGAEEALNTALVQDVCAGRLRTLPLQEMPDNCVPIVRQYITRTEIDRDLSNKIAFFFRDKPTFKNTIHLVRGLLTYGILVMTLKRRWNVQYGLHPNRDPISVPFHAKGSPSDHAEWGHPDVSLLFTTLSFYYGGLNVAQLKQALDHLLQSDDPASEFEKWVENAGNIPDSLQVWSYINTGDALQLATLHGLLSHCQPTIKYFVNRFVFPVHAKQFAIKLQASGWDLPHFTPQQAVAADSTTSETPRTTGFSGTNDQRDVLPLTIKQNDLSALLQTNAGVLTTLLEPRNREYIHMQDQQGRRLSEFGILQLLKSKNVTVMIDAGAAIVSATNQELVIEWLKIWPTAPAAVYFDQKGRAIVRYHKGHETPLVNSPYADDLASLLVFVDHQHVRGTDLKFPPKAKGAVTLTLGQTKDASVQAALRLRQLQSTQSICWLAPPEVHQSVVDAMAPDRSGKLDSYDVVWWLLEQSCRSIEQSLPLFTVQGETFCDQSQAHVKFPNFVEDATHRKQLLSKLHQVECQSLEDLYDPFTQQKVAQKQSGYSRALLPFITKLWDCRKVFQDKGIFHSGALEEVEQEREVTAEAEVVRELQKPSDFKAMVPNQLHKDIRELLRTGAMRYASQAWVDVFTAMSRTKVGSKNGVQSASNRVPLYVSEEYLRTIKTKHVQFMDNFTRPANWLLLVPRLQQGLLVSPEEAELMLPLLRQKQGSRVNLVLYSAPVTRKMRIFEELDLYSVPALPNSWTASPFLKVLLGVFAGFLYFDHGMFEHLRQFLNDAKTAKRSGNSPLAKEGILIARPLPFFKAWLDVRTKGQEYYETPAGYVSQGKDIPADHRFFRQQERDGVIVPGQMDP